MSLQDFKDLHKNDTVEQKLKTMLELTDRIAQCSARKENEGFFGSKSYWIKEEEQAWIRIDWLRHEILTAYNEAECKASAYDEYLDEEEV